MRIENENDLRRENLKSALALLPPFTPEQMERLCREIVNQWRRDAGLDRAEGEAACAT